jgi:uncharacterized membrane protein YfcA
VASVTSVTGLVAVLRQRKHRPRLAAGLMIGMAIGIALLVVLSVRIVGLFGQVGSTCPCEPLIDQLRNSPPS